MEPWYPVVIGSVIFFYIQFFIRNMKMYLQSGKTLGLQDMFSITHMGLEPMTSRLEGGRSIQLN
jgi:hypothetical protein